MRIRQLADESGISHSAASRLAGRLEESHILARYECAADRRGTYTALTDVGRALRKEAEATYQAAVTEMMSSVAASELLQRADWIGGASPRSRMKRSSAKHPAARCFSLESTQETFYNPDGSRATSAGFAGIPPVIGLAATVSKAKPNRDVFIAERRRLNSKMTRLLASTTLAACLSLSGVGILLAQATAADFEALSAAASEARAGGDAAKAAGLYTEALALRPDWQEGWWFLGVLSYGADRYEPAIDAFNRYLALNPDGGPALALRGLCEFEARRYPESLQDLRRAIALGAADNPRNGAIVRYHEALLLTRLGRFEEAIGRYSAMIRKGQDNVELPTAIGLAGLRMAVLPTEIEPDQQALVAAAGRAGMQVVSGDEAGGDAAFAEIFKLFPHAPNVHYFHGYLLLSTDPVRAAAEFQQEAAASPGNANAHAMLAWADSMEGDFAASLPNAKLAAAEDPSLPLGQLVIGKALVETGDASGGAAHLETLLRMQPSNLEGHLAIAKAYANLGRADDARRERLLCLQLAGLGAATDAKR